MRTITFLNGDIELQNKAEKYLESRIEDFEFFQITTNEDHDSAKQDVREHIKRNNLSISQIKQLLYNIDSYGSFFDYGLSFDYVELGTFNNQSEDYFRYQLSWGGPSDEIRFYYDGTIEYVYLDWFTGIGFDVTEEDWAEWLRNWFDGCGLLNFDEKRDETDYYSQLIDLQDAEETND